MSEMMNVGSSPEPFTREERDYIQSGIIQWNDLAEQPDRDMPDYDRMALRYEATVQDLEALVRRLERDLVAAWRAQ